jgi:hypothetical protein
MEKRSHVDLELKKVKSHTSHTVTEKYIQWYSIIPTSSNIISYTK